MENRLEEIKRRLDAGKEVSLAVKVSAGAKISRLLGFLTDGTLKLAVAQAPEKGKANAAVVKLLAGIFKVREDNIQIARGQTSPAKVVKIKG